MLLKISQLLLFSLLAINYCYAERQYTSGSPFLFSENELGIGSDKIDNEILSLKTSTTFSKKTPRTKSLREYEKLPSAKVVSTTNNSKIKKTDDKKKQQPSFYNNTVNRKPVDKKKTQPTFYYNNNYKKQVSKKNDVNSFIYDEDCNCPDDIKKPQLSYFSKTENKIRAATLEKYRFSERPVIAVKTNLLFDAASALNIEIEAPIGKRWSVAGEYMFPWWTWDNKQYCLQIISGSLEGRYWLGDRRGQERMTGWFAGLYAGGGYYDIEWGDKGYQGEFFIASGMSGGYAHTISKDGNWRMEYSLGIGYLQTKYREYAPKKGIDDQWHLIHQANGKNSWFGPTKAKISLVWTIDLSFKKKGGSR